MPRSCPCQRKQCRRSLSLEDDGCAGRSGRACGAGSGGGFLLYGRVVCCQSGVASEGCVTGMLLSRGELGGQDICQRELPAGLGPPADGQWEASQ